MAQRHHVALVAVGGAQAALHRFSYNIWFENKPQYDDLAAINTSSTLVVRSPTPERSPQLVDFAEESEEQASSPSTDTASDVSDEAAPTVEVPVSGATVASTAQEALLARGWARLPDGSLIPPAAGKTRSWCEHALPVSLLFLAAPAAPASVLPQVIMPVRACWGLRFRRIMLVRCATAVAQTVMRCPLWLLQGRRHPVTAGRMCPLMFLYGAAGVSTCARSLSVRHSVVH